MTVIGQSTTSHSVNVPGAERPAVLSWGLDTHTGYRRRHNEDSAVAKPPIFAVADGMGGHSAGDVASKAVVTRLAEAAEGEVTTAEIIDTALKAATADISLAADHSHLGVGTTVTGAALMAKGGVPHVQPPAELLEAHDLPAFLPRDAQQLLDHLGRATRFGESASPARDHGGGRSAA